MRLLNLRDQLPGVNVSSLVARWPYIVLDYDAPAFNARLEHMRWVGSLNRSGRGLLSVHFSVQVTM